MKVFKVDFTFFCGVAWNRKQVSVTAETEAQLKSAVIDELIYMNDSSTTIEKEWADIQSRIVEEELEFPIIVSKEL